MQVELLPQLLRMMDVKTMTGSEGQRKLTLGNATILAYCLRWAGFRVSASTHIICQDVSTIPVLLPAESLYERTCSNVDLLKILFETWVASSQFPRQGPA